MIYFYLQDECWMW